MTAMVNQKRVKRRVEIVCTLGPDSKSTKVIDGVQLADFLAHMTMRSFVKGPYDSANRVTILSREGFVSFGGCKGILLAVASKSRKKYIYESVERYRPRSWLTSENR
jgi:hypothetical protein